MRLVGASNWSIQLPFMLEGLLAGFVGALVASGALVALKVFAIDRGLRETFQFTAFVGWDEVLSVLPWLFLTGVAAAVVGLIAVTVVMLTRATVEATPNRVASLLVFLLALAIMYRWKSKLATPAVLAMGAAVGLVALR